MNADAASLDHLTAGTPTVGAARNVEGSVLAFGGVLDRIAHAINAGRMDEANAIHVSKAYNDSIARVQQSIKTLVLSAHNQRSGANLGLQRLWTASFWLLLIAIAGMLGASVFAVLHASSLVNAIQQLVAKTERRRRGEPLGESSPRRDELGTLDSALYDLVAEQHRREQLLDRYRLLSEVTEDIILFVDRSDLTIVDANAAALKAYQYELAELVGKPVSMLAANGVSLPAEVVARSDTSAGLRNEMMHRRADGSVFPIEMHARTANIEGRPTIIGTGRDISERREAAEQVAKALDQAVEGSRLKSEFVATMSHEIRTPMHGVIGMSELLLQTTLTVQQHEYAATVKESAQALLAIINDILDFSRLEANKLELETVAFDPQQVVGAVISLARGTARDKGLTLRSVASQHMPGAVRGDPKRLRQVLMNLVGNAVKFTPSGSVSVSSSVERETADAVVLAFTVSDTGIGVAPEARNRVFEAFVQGDGTTTRDFGGTGLGLSISRRLVELMGGRLWLGDHDGPGSTFCFTARFERTSEAAVPVPLSATAPRVLVLDDDPAVRRTSPRARILLAEDSALIRRVGRSQFEQLDIDVDVVENGKQAVTAEATGDYELVLMDLRMPVMDGFAATRAIRAKEGENGRHVVVVALTANVLDSDREACTEAGMDDFLAKPMQLDALRTVLERWLPGRI
jgi:PAS domain S-box-containing protein